MNINELKELIKVVSESELVSFDYEEGNIKIALKKECAGGSEIVNVKENEKYKNVSGLEHIEKKEVKEADYAVEEDSTNINGKDVVSPLVGTVYLSPKEGAEPFVKVGDTVKKGQTLAIVEAMKLMNEIESEYDGIVKAVLVENAKTVEYGQQMFVIA